MDPLAILHALWRQRVLAIPVVLLTLILAGVVFLFGPRTYESSATYVLINPKVPTQDELDKNSALARLNSDNPYLRSSDPSLAAQVLVSTLSSDTTAERLRQAGLGPEFSVQRSATNSMLVIVTGYGSKPPQSLATTQWLSQRLIDTLRDMQKVNGADDIYLFTALPVDSSVEAKEKVSSRLRALILVLVAGGILLFGVVSIGVARDRHRGSGHPPGARSLLSRRGARQQAERGQVPSWDWIAEGPSTAVSEADRPTHGNPEPSRQEEANGHQTDRQGHRLAAGPR
jgi:capsular polysaccharide biosynthesis protein